MKIIISIVFIFLTNAVFLQELQLDWLLSSNHNDIYSSKKTAINNSDSCLYSIGIFNNQMSIEGNEITSNYPKSVFLLKNGKNGDVKWLKKIADINYEVELTSRSTIEIDNDGNILAGISFNEKIYFNNDSIVLNIENNKGVALFKLDTASNFIWEKQIYAESLGKEGIKVDSQNNLYLTGTSNQDVFLSKYTELGDSLWTKFGGSSAGLDGGTIIKIDSADNVYIVGNIYPSNSIYFDSYHPTFTIPYNNGSFLAKYNPLGEIQWVRCFYSSDFGQYVNASSFILLSDNEIVVAGGFNGSQIKFYPNSPVLGGNNSGYDASFLLSYNSLGELLWKKKPHNNYAGYTGITRLSKNEDTKFYATTTFSGSIGVLNDTLSGSSIGNCIIEEYDNLGNSLWYNRYGGENLFSTIDLIVSQSEIFITGTTNSNPIYFNGTSYLLDSNPSFYVVKLHDNIVSLSEEKLNTFTLFPNPTNSSVILQSKESLLGKEVSIYNALGELMSRQKMNHLFENEILLPESTGIYFIRIYELNFIERVVKN